MLHGTWGTYRSTGTMPIRKKTLHILSRGGDMVKPACSGMQELW